MKKLTILLLGAALFLSTPITEVQAARSVSIAKKYIGKNPTGQRYLWCADFINYVHRKVGVRSTKSRAARSFLQAGKRVSRKSARPGDVVYRARGRSGGHVELFVRWANKNKTKYVAITGNTCGKRGRRYVCQVTRSAKRMQVVVRMR